MRTGLRILLILALPLAAAALAAIYYVGGYSSSVPIPPPKTVVTTTTTDEGVKVVEKTIVAPEASAPAPVPEVKVEAPPAPVVDLCINYRGDQDQVWLKEKGLTLLPNGECHPESVLKKMLAEETPPPAKEEPPLLKKGGKADEKGLEITLPDFQSEFWRKGVVRLALFAGLALSLFTLFAVKQTRAKGIAILGTILLGGILLITISGDPAGTWTGLLNPDLSWIPDDIPIRNEVILLVVFAGMIAIALKAMKTKNFFPVFAAIFLIGVVVMNWYGVIGADWWPLRDTEYGHRVVHDCWDPGPCAPAPEPLPAGWEYETDY